MSAPTKKPQVRSTQAGIFVPRRAECVAGSPGALVRLHGDWQRATGISAYLWGRVGINDANLTAAQAMAALKRRVGARAWDRAMATEGSAVAKSTALIRALQAQDPSPPLPQSPKHDAAGDADEEEEQSKKCSSCKKLNRPGASFCKHCSSPVRSEDDEAEDDEGEKPMSSKKPGHEKSRASRIEAAKKNPSVLRMFHRPGNTHSLDKIAAQWVASGDALRAQRGGAAS